MKNYIPILKRSILFQSIEGENIEAMLGCLNAFTRNYKKGELIFHAEENIQTVGMVLTGFVHISKDDVWGNQTIMAQLSPGDMFGEVYACLPEVPLDVNVIARLDCDILFLDIHKIISVCGSSCSFHTQLIHNLLMLISKKNYQLNQKIDCLSKRSTREKLLSYLSSESLKQNSSSFTIPFNRQQLSDYLCVDRSAMSNELCKLRNEEILTFHKNDFTLHSDYFDRL